MDGSTNNFPFGQGNWQTRQDYGSYNPNTERNRVQPVLPRLLPLGVTRNTGGVAMGLSFEERMMTGPLGLASFPPPIHSPAQNILLEIDRTRNPYPRPTRSIPQPLPRFSGQLNLQNLTADSESKLTPDEQKTALQKLKKEIYNPTPKRITKRLNLYYRDNSTNSWSANEREKEKETDDDGKRCAICLDDFEPKELVVLTPCDHMFHEDCIVPWVKNHGKCPVCRFAICERMRETAATSNNVFGNAATGDPLAGHLIEFMTAMEEVVQWGRWRLLR